MTSLVVIAKEPLPGKAKTRLHPPLSLDQAAELAAAAIDDTLAAVAAVPASRRILLFDGVELPPRAGGWDVIPQVSGTLDERLAAVFDELDGPTLLIGMDTPQVSALDLAPAFGGWPYAAYEQYDAWFGPAPDGGFLALGLAHPRGDLVRGIPMSRDDTGRLQLQRLSEAGLLVGMLPTLTDVDTIDTAYDVAELVPTSLFATTLAGFEVPVVAGHPQ